LSKSQDVSATGNLAYIVGRGASGPQAGLPDLLRLRALGAAARLRVVVAEAEGDCAARLGGSVSSAVSLSRESKQKTASRSRNQPANHSSIPK
jgi:hypothetical protein